MIIPKAVGATAIVMLGMVGFILMLGIIFASDTFFGRKDWMKRDFAGHILWKEIDAGKFTFAMLGKFWLCLLIIVFLFIIERNFDV